VESNLRDCLSPKSGVPREEGRIETPIPWSRLALPNEQRGKAEKLNAENIESTLARHFSASNFSAFKRIGSFWLRKLRMPSISADHVQSARVPGVDLPLYRSELRAMVIGRSPPVTAVGRSLGGGLGEASPQDRLRIGRSPTPGTRYNLA
jgi:hypothetical protein